jgi:hypothetical protein
MFGVYMSEGILAMMPDQSLPAPKPVMALINFGIVIILYGGLGFIGLKLSTKIGFQDLWDSKISNKNKILLPAIIGVIIGILFIIIDSIFT